MLHSQYQLQKVNDMTNIAVMTTSNMQEIMGDYAAHMTRLMLDDIDETFAVTMTCKHCNFPAATVEEAVNHLIKSHKKGKVSDCKNPHHDHS